MADVGRPFLLFSVSLLIEDLITIELYKTLKHVIRLSLGNAKSLRLRLSL